LKNETNAVVAIRIPVFVAVAFGANFVDFKLAFGVMIKPADNI
jgi:hypothetical protein